MAVDTIAVDDVQPGVPARTHSTGGTDRCSTGSGNVLLFSCSNDLELTLVSEFDLSAERAAGVRRAETLARKINLLLDVIMSDSGKPYDYPAIRDGALKAGYYLSRTRWSLLKSGREQVVPDEALRAIATVFDVNPEYLLQDGGKLPERVEAELELLRSMRRAEVRNFAARALGPVDPEALRAIAKILDEE